jgi:hypothetical protein
MENLNSIIGRSINQPALSKSEKIEELNKNISFNIKYLKNLIESTFANGGDNLTESLRQTQEVTLMKRSLLVSILQLAKEKEVSLSEILRFLQEKYGNQIVDESINDEALFLSFLEQEIEGNEPISLAKAIDSYVISERNSKAVIAVGATSATASIILSQINPPKIPTNIPELIDTSIPLATFGIAIAALITYIKLNIKGNDLKRKIKGASDNFIDEQIYPYSDDDFTLDLSNPSKKPS